MLLIIKLAFRNVFRNFRRSLLTFLSITIILGLAIMAIGFTRGFETGSLKTAVNTRTGHVKILSRDYDTENPVITLDHTISDPENLMSQLQNISSVRSYSEKILFPCSLTDGIDELALIGFGVNLDREDRVFNLSQHVIRGSYLSPGEEKILLGNDLAKLFGVDVGDYITIITRTKYNSINALDVEIAGIYVFNNPELDSNAFFFPLDAAQEFLDMQNQVTEITVFGDNMDRADALAESLMENIDPELYKTQTWEENLEELLKFFNLRAKSRMIIYFILLMMAAAGIMNTMLMAVYERTREIGTLMAMGFREGKMIRLFAMESVYIGIFGSITGCLWGGLVANYFENNGLDMNSFGFEIGNLPISPIIYGDIDFTAILTVFITGILLAFFSALYPAYKSSKLVPTEALRAV
ncbi:MAG: ABC transporter permease [bacterium]|nr:ABC transporter permease [bacterium]